MSIQYEGAIYHLASYTYSKPWDVVIHGYYVFECDASGSKCSKIFEEVGGREYPTKLYVSDNKLMYQYDTTNYQILPAVN